MQTVNKLSEISKILNGYAFKSKNYVEKGIRVLRIANVQDGYIVDDAPCFYPVASDEDVEKYALFAGDLLISLTGNVGRVGILTADMLPAALNQRVCCLRIDETIVDRKYLFFYLRRNQFMRDCIKASKGVAQLNLCTKWLADYEIPLPEIEEQKRIVARIEELFSELDNGVETLRKTKQQLAVYRQAVLKQAFDGKLTGCTSIREVALKDLVSGKDGLRRGPFGSAIKKAFFVPDGFKVYEQGNAINDDPYRGHYYISQEKYEELKNFHIKPHDLLVSCSGVTLGRIVELPENAKPGVINQALLRIRLNHEMIATRYFIEYFRSEMFQRKIFDKSQGSAMPNLVGITEFREITLNVPASIDDQLAIVGEIENRLSVCDNIEKTVDTALQQAEAMRQSILKQAFEGRL